MEKSNLVLPESKAELTQIIISNAKVIERLEEEVRLLRQLLFAPKSEKLLSNKYLQLALFDMPENPPEEDEEPADTVTIPEHIRTKKKGRKKLPDSLPRLDRIHDIPEEDKICGCGCKLSKIGEDVTEKLDIEPAKIRVIRHIRPKYSCRSCEGVEDDTSVKIAPAPPQIIPKGLPTAGLLTHVLVAKFCDALPFYRQEKRFIRLGIDIPRQSMCNWAMKAADSCQPLLDLLKKEIREGPLLNIDETTVQVLKEPGRSPTTKSYMWVFRGGKMDNPVVLFQYHPTRSGDVAKLFVDDYQGVVQTDGYAGYNFLDDRHGILHVGCWAHARRKFMDIRKASPRKKDNNSDALSMINNLYNLERVAKNDHYTPSELYDMRQKQAKPILRKFKSWLEKRKDSVPPKTLLGKAVTYCLNQWSRLERYIEDGNAGIDNNVAENAIRPFVLGRKNWLFSGTPDGAKASALLYSLIETAKANGLEPYAYLRFLFETLPVTAPESLDTLLPTRLSPNDLVLSDMTTGV
ncbi:MAG TPA: IS66 family transposase [Gammaproteobacteria bacterium]|nr:IS66 family transposase [Gammaproteobacteria bacterium]